jgi:hypothetical protein
LSARIEYCWQAALPQLPAAVHRRIRQAREYLALSREIAQASLPAAEVASCSDPGGWQ